MSQVVSWFDASKRDLPWRDPQAGPWAVLVSEVMLQQTPVSRVLPVYSYWLARWPTPEDLAGESLSEVLRAWDRMGYPRRAQRLQEAARMILRDHGGEVPSDLDALLALPGVGDYTARAVRCFAFGIPEPVVDTNVRRVVARLTLGQAEAGPPRTRQDMREAQHLLDTLSTSGEKVTGAAALMELGAVVCTARKPACNECPVSFACNWKAAGYPSYTGPIAPKQPRFEGSDRQVRGIILRELRNSDIPVSGEFLESLWSQHAQVQRALGSLLADGLVEQHSENPPSYCISAPTSG
jgi:A/G-specific adenine glycosylase